MGQRSQIYIRLENVGKAWAKRMNLDDEKAWKNNIEKYVEYNSYYETWKTMYGEGDTIIVAFHHGWLYGRTFAKVASKILEIAKWSSTITNNSENIFCCDFWEAEWAYHNSKLIGDRDNPHKLIEWIENSISILFDFELSPYTREGNERFHLLNSEEDGISYSKDFTIGDNNDGVLIIDFPSNKYCFVNINESKDVKLFPYLKPIDASMYLKIQYPESAEDVNQDNGKKTKKELKDNKKVNAIFLKRFEGFQTLTADDLKVMFPSLKRRINIASKVD